MNSEDIDGEQVTGKAIGGRARAEQLSPERKREIARMGAKARWSQPNTSKSGIANALATITIPSPNTPSGQMEFQIEKRTEIDGIEMGVLTGGIPYLSGRSLARLCGVNAGRISEMQSAWATASDNSMTAKVKAIMVSHGVTVEDAPYIEVKQRSGGSVYAYPDVVCVAVLEYYAFEAQTPSEVAVKNFRKLAGKALQEFIYAQVGYDPNNKVPPVWRDFHDRVSLVYNSLPKGYFGVFKEMADMIVTLGQVGLHLDSSIVPDISVGRCWSDYWVANDLDKQYGARLKFEHNFPLYFPQAVANPQPAWCYPEDALGIFRKWMRDEYIPKKFKNYLTQAAKKKNLPASFVQIAIGAYTPESLPSPS
ncbi:MAG: hypothetical protein IT366_04965 [Candidatus Hydrogenedentes bacterium]|nr:hypothetical protein [Candidatus Hydrogenedentota bacterium]